jgi:L-fuconolactonase
MIDAHVHFWDPARKDDILIVRREPTLDKRAMPDELAPLLKKAGVSAAVAIQSAPNDEETDHLIRTSMGMSEVRAVVGWVDLTAPDCASRISALRARPKVAGVRAMLNRVGSVDWLSSDAVRAGLAALEASGLSLDLITRTEHVPAIAKIAAEFPRLRLIVDHGASPPSGRSGFREWQAAVATLGARTRAFTKFSGFAEEAPESWTAATLAPAFAHLVECFGASRIMWASNWPVIDLRGGYMRWVEESRRILDVSSLGLDERQAIESGTARTAYKIESD